MVVVGDEFHDAVDEFCSCGEFTAFEESSSQDRNEQFDLIQPSRTDPAQYSSARIVRCTTGSTTTRCVSHAPRIIAGSLRGRRLVVPADGVRPTKDRVKASVFSALDARGLLQDAVVLDAYAGSGALGFEALSRGAVAVTFVESDRAALIAIRGSIATFGVASEVVVISEAMPHALARLRSTFDLAFLDPPYELDREIVNAQLEVLAAKLPGGTIVIEGPVRGGGILAPQGWSVVWERTFGDTLVVFIQSAPVTDVVPGADS